MMHSISRQLVRSIFFLISGSAALYCFAADAPPDDRLGRIEQELVEGSTIEHLPWMALVRTMENNASPVLFDVREADEFAVSHLENAIRVDPDISASDFIARYGSMLNEEQVIFYCATGVRSTALAERVQAELVARQAASQALVNLRGGIFRWHNSQQPLVNTAGKTKYVHPYSWWQKRLLTHKDLASYDPVVEQQ